MYWKDKYDKAILDGKQLIGDKVMRNTFYNENPEAITIEEVRFPEFQADILEFIELKNKLMLVGFEFKSDRDNLDKLEVQLRGVSEVLQFCSRLCHLKT